MGFGSRKPTSNDPNDALHDDRSRKLMNAAMRSDEEDMARTLGNRIGYGRMMQLGEQLWREMLAKTGLEGGEHSTGCAVTFLVPCDCAQAHKCDWCCGAGRVTKRVSQAQRESEK